MKISFRFYWGILLIVGGLLALAQSLGYLDRLSPQVAIVAFIVVSLLAFVGYWQSDWKDWGWLFPAGIFGGLAITAALALVGIDHAIIATPIFLGLTLPFAVAFLSDRARNWWALIPGSIMLMLAVITALVESTNGGAWIGSLVLFMFAFGFFAVYLNNSRQQWALLVAYIFVVLSIAPLMSAVGNYAGYYASIVLLGIALPFFFVYVRAPEQRWWAIIPVGILTTIATITTLAMMGFIRSQNEGGYVNALLMGGLAATFAVLWLRHNKVWAKIVTIVLTAITLLSVIFASNSQVLFPVAIILVGGYLLFSAMRPKQV